MGMDIIKLKVTHFLLFGWNEAIKKKPKQRTNRDENLFLRLPKNILL